jgi:hypothetical protein
MNTAEALAERLNKDAVQAREAYVSPEEMEEARLPKAGQRHHSSAGALTLETDQKGAPRDKFSFEDIQAKQEELRQILHSRVNQIEDTADELNNVISSVFIGTSSAFSFIKRAFRGTKVPAEAGELIDAINDKLEVLEEIRDKIFEDLVESRELLTQASRTPDRHNRIVLKHRAFHACIRPYAHERLEHAQSIYEKKLRNFEELG